MQLILACLFILFFPRTKLFLLLLSSRALLFSTLHFPLSLPYSNPSISLPFILKSFINPFSPPSLPFIYHLSIFLFIPFTSYPSKLTYSNHAFPPYSPFPNVNCYITSKPKELFYINFSKCIHFTLVRSPPLPSLYTLFHHFTVSFFSFTLFPLSLCLSLHSARLLSPAIWNDWFRFSFAFLFPPAILNCFLLNRPPPPYLILSTTK